MERIDFMIIRLSVFKNGIISEIKGEKNIIGLYTNNMIKDDNLLTDIEIKQLDEDNNTKNNSQEYTTTPTSLSNNKNNFDRFFFEKKMTEKMIFPSK